MLEILLFRVHFVKVLIELDCQQQVKFMGVCVTMVTFYLSWN